MGSATHTDTITMCCKTKYYSSIT